MAMSGKVSAFIEKQDSALNKLAGWDSNDLAGYARALFTSGSVEVGYRSSCGRTDRTQKIYSAWIKVVKKLKNDGLDIDEDVQRHKNAYATNAGGFWNSTVFTIKLHKDT